MSKPVTPPQVHTVGGIGLSPEFAALVMQASPSVALITSATEAGSQTHLQEGTSFCVDTRGFFLTAFHHVKGSSSWYIFTGGGVVPLTLVAVEEKLDLALFKVKQSQCQFVPLELATLPLEKDELVVGVGFQAGRLIVSPAAYVACYQGQFVDGTDPQQPRVSCPTLPGAAWFIVDGIDLSGFSGGPLLNAGGKVVAVTEMGDGDMFIAGTSAQDVLNFLAANLS